MSAPARVLVVYPHLPHYRYGVFTELASSASWDVTFASDDSSRDGSIATIPLNGLQHVLLRNAWLGPFLWQRGLLGHVLRHRYDAVIALGDAKYLTTWVMAVAMRLLRRPVLFWTIGWHRPDIGVARRVRLAFYRLADGLLLYGEVARGIGEEMGFPRARMHVVGNSCTSQVSGESAGDARVDTALSDLRPRCLLMVGRLTAVKSLDLVLRAVGSAPGLRDEVTVVLAGDGPEAAALQSLARDLGVDARFPGAVYDGESLGRLYDVADVTVVPGAAGLTVIQSLEHGVPVITHDSAYHQMPEAEAVVPGRTGALFRRGDPADLARAIVELLDRTDLASLDHACRDEVRDRWSAEVHARRIEDAVDELLCRGGA